MCCIVSATGNTLPPVFIFPKKQFKNFMLNGSPEGSLGHAHPSGWMTSESFLQVIHHFIKYVRPTEIYPVILILDNHESHLSYAALELAKRNNIHVITLPPHTSHKLQPLDRTVFGPMKAAFNNLADSWQIKYARQTLSIYQLVELRGTAFLKASTKQNILSGFKTSGVWPLDKDIFLDEEFLPSDVTDRPMVADPELPDIDIARPRAHCSSSSPDTDTPFVPDATPQGDTSINVLAHTISSDAASPKMFASPEIFAGYPKAAPRKQTNRGKKRGKCMLATSSPMMEEIKLKHCVKSGDISNVKKNLFDTDMTDDRTDNISDSSDSSDESIDVRMDGVESVNVNDYVLCEFEVGKKAKYLVGKVMKEEDEDGDIEVSFLRKSGKMVDKFF
ncbi:uncharacterized protein LOC129928222 [Biomphalaria glabrata]|uniref:Uncharacterized protein LOC129928222 n=1 Tax=Biomphalaria glabrata TaxID=6526 RepID=A0A9W3BDG5_BIOGL|nr:uncharacterized protein LOC129928222 [Biomphalaria glabrata]